MEQRKMAAAFKGRWMEDRVPRRTSRTHHELALSHALQRDAAALQGDLPLQHEVKGVGLGRVGGWVGGLVGWLVGGWGVGE